VKALEDSLRTQKEALAKAENDALRSELTEIKAALAAQATAVAAKPAEKNPRDAAREMFWERIAKLAASHGVFRLWTQEDSPFWVHQDFQPPDDDAFARLPEEWKNLEGRWLTLELKNEDAIKSALGDQFADFVNAEKKQTAEVAAKARKIRAFFTIIFFAISIIGFAIAIFLLLRHPLTTR
jgi:hypothetical protein